MALVGISGHWGGVSLSRGHRGTPDPGSGLHNLFLNGKTGSWVFLLFHALCWRGGVGGTGALQSRPGLYRGGVRKQGWRRLRGSRVRVCLLALVPVSQLDQMTVARP